MSNTYAIKPSSVKKGSYLMFNEYPCKVIDIAFFKPGKHGSAKYKFIGLGIAAKKKYEITFSSHQMAQAPIVSKEKYPLVDIDEEYLNLMHNETGEMINHVKLPDGDLGQQIKNKFDEGDNLLITIMSVTDHEIVMDFSSERDIVMD